MYIQFIYQLIESKKMCSFQFNEYVIKVIISIHLLYNYIPYVKQMLNFKQVKFFFKNVSQNTLKFQRSFTFVGLKADTKKLN